MKDIPEYNNNIWYNNLLTENQIILNFGNDIFYGLYDLELQRMVRKNNENAYE